MVSPRWHIGQEAGSGEALIIRDVISSIGGIDARYKLVAGRTTDL
jgi:predicted aconitase with swiveling domain